VNLIENARQAVAVEDDQSLALASGGTVVRPTPPTHVILALEQALYELDREGVEQLAQWVNELTKFWATKLDALETEMRK
jgi:aspartate aminotransferase-like enzyme